MGYCDDVINGVRKQIDASDAPLGEARLTLVKKTGAEIRVSWRRLLVSSEL
jgi:hypothetical protein